MNSDPRVIRKYRVFLAIELSDAQAEDRPTNAEVVDIDGQAVTVIPLEPIYITLAYTPGKAMRWNRDSAEAKNDALDRSRTLYLRDHPEVDGKSIVLLDAQFLKTFVRENDRKVGR